MIRPNLCRLMKSMRSLSAFILIILSINCSFSQDRPIVVDDSVFVEAEERAELFQELSDLDPQRAALLSAILPGLGQVYNRQYWKVPIVVSGMLVFGHYINYNNRVYHSLRNAALIENAGGDNPYSDVINNSTALVRNRDIFRRNRDFMIVLGSAFYLLQIVDAHVSAHLNEFIVNEDLALQIKPSIKPTPLFSQAVGISFALRF